MKNWGEPSRSVMDRRIQNSNRNPVAFTRVKLSATVNADQMLRHYECSCDEFVRRLHEGNPPPTTLRKSLYLEWFSNRNGRVVIQCTRLAVERIGDALDEQSSIQKDESNESGESS